MSTDDAKESVAVTSLHTMQAPKADGIARLLGRGVPPESTQRSRRLLTLRETAATLAASVASARRLIASGHLPVVRFNRRLLVDSKDLEAFIQRAKQPSR